MRFFSGFLIPGLLLNAFSVLAVFKDEAYITDWHIPLIGPSIAASTFFHQPNVETRASLIYTLTTRSVLAAINPKDGAIVWRQQLSASEDGNGIARAGISIVVTATGPNVASFDAGTGRLVWDNKFKSNVVDVRVMPSNEVAVLTADGTVRLLSEQSGDAIWEWAGLDRYISRLLSSAFCLTVAIRAGRLGRIPLSLSTLWTRRSPWPLRRVRSSISPPSRIPPARLRPSRRSLPPLLISRRSTMRFTATMF